jgi:hypothetical protein
MTTARRSSRPMIRTRRAKPASSFPPSRTMALSNAPNAITNRSSSISRSWSKQPAVPPKISLSTSFSQEWRWPSRFPPLRPDEWSQPAFKSSHRDPFHSTALKARSVFNLYFRKIISDENPYFRSYMGSLNLGWKARIPARRRRGAVLAPAAMITGRWCCRPRNDRESITSPLCHTAKTAS